MNDLSKPWLGTLDRMVQYCPIECEEMIPAKLVFLVDTFGAAFDDDWYYWRAKKRNKKKVVKRPIKRTAVWFGQKRCPLEKPKDPFQKKLEFEKVCVCVLPKQENKQ